MTQCYIWLVTVIIQVFKNEPHWHSFVCQALLYLIKPPSQSELLSQYGPKIMIHKSVQFDPAFLPPWVCPTASSSQCGFPPLHHLSPEANIEKLRPYMSYLPE